MMKLLPCPFCGDSATQRVNVNTAQLETGCPGCRVWMVPAIWNRRQPLKREPNAATQALPEGQREVLGATSGGNQGPAPAAPDVASMVKRAVKEMKFFQSVRSRVPADAQYDEWIALLARLSPGASDE